MAALTAFYADRLRRAGFRVIEPMDEDDWRRCLASELQRFGYRVAPPLQPPKVGATGIPTRAGSSQRHVLVADKDGVIYERVPSGHTRTVSVAAWHVWVERTRAVVT